MVRKRRVGHTCDESRDVEQVVDFSQVGVGKSMTREAAKNASRCKSTRC